MKNRNSILILLIFLSNIIYSQVKENLYQLNDMDNLLTNEVKEIISNELSNKRIVFLGESGHHIGSDFLAKTQFVKYLVKEKGYKDIVFESDFFGLYFEHEKHNVFAHWSLSKQCQELFEFLDNNDVTMWGFDNQSHSYFTYYNFAQKLSNFFDENSIPYNDKFISLVDKVVKSGFDAKKELNKEEVEYLLTRLDQYLLNKEIISNKLWYQFIESFKSTAQIYTVNNSKKEGVPIRDKQMARNLDFLINKFPEKKFIAWLANSHMAKFEYDFMKGKTMGSQFVEKNPGISYHIAVSSVNMPYRSKRKIKKAKEDKQNLLNFLPSTDQNYFIDSNQIIKENSEYETKEFEGWFNLDKSNTNWFKHFDALVFIGIGERREYIKK